MRDGQHSSRHPLYTLLLLGVGTALALALSTVSGSAKAATDPHSERSVAPPADYGMPGQAGDWTIGPAAVTTYTIYLPLLARAETCAPIPGESYGTLSVYSPPTDRPAEIHADLNLAMRGYELTTAYKGLLDLGGGSDPGAPQLPGLFPDNRTGVFTNVYQVYDWNWSCNCRGDLLTNPGVTLAGFEVTQDETIHVPNSGYDLGDGYRVLVLYASMERITLKYTRDDNVVSGYTLHIENVCVEPSLLALYETSNLDGRGHLPALRAGQALGRARGAEIGVAIRDNGTFMDPRSRKDWWRGR